MKSLGKQNHVPSVKSVMTPFQYSIDGNDLLGRAQDEMAEHGVRHLPVLIDGCLASVLSERDLRIALQADPDSPRTRRVAEVATRKAYVVELTEPLDVVLHHMAHAHADCALVVKDGKLVGIFTSTDACRAFGELLGEIYPRGGGDEAA